MAAALFPPLLRRTLLALLCAVLAGLGGLSRWGGPAAVPVSAATTYTVNDLGDTGTGSGTTGDLRYAITQVNAGSGGDTITFSVAGTITLGSLLPTLEKDVTIQGPGASALAVDGNNGRQVLSVDFGVAATISGLTIQHGHNPDNGGGIYNLGTLTVTNSTLSGNSATRGGGIYNVGGTVTVTNSTLSGNSAAVGGGIENDDGTLTVTDSTLSGNSAATGGGIENWGTLTVTNSTLSGNSAYGDGGGIENWGTLTVTNSTLSGNSAYGDGGGIYNVVTATLTNTIVASNTGGDLSGAVSGNNNLIGDTSAITGTGNITNTPPLLGTLSSYGGPTPTIPLLPDSPAINAGAPVGSGPAGNPIPGTDQRGVARPQGGVDIGAFESQGFTLTQTGGDSQSTDVSTAFASPLAVSVTSGYSEPVNGGKVTFTAIPGGSGQSATLGTPNPATIASGAASVTATANSIAGTYTVMASASGAASVSFALTNTPGPPQSIVASGGTPQSAAINAVFATPLTATVTDAWGNPLSGLSVTFTVTPAGNGASGYFVVSPVETTNSSGVATAPLFIANGIAGAYSVTANLTTGPLGTSAPFALTNTVGAPSSLTVGTGTTPQSAPVTTVFANPLAVTARDGSDNPIPNLPITFTAPATGPSGTFAGGGNSVTVQTDSSGVAPAPTFTANTTTGAYYVMALDGNGHTAFFTLTNTTSAPTLTAITPDTGILAGGGTVTLTGTGFISGATVAFGGAAATQVTVVNVTTLTVRAPAHAAGAVDVVVRNTDGGTVSRAGGYTYGAIAVLPSPQPPGGTPGSPNPLPGARPAGPTDGPAPNPLPAPRS